MTVLPPCRIAIVHDAADGRAALRAATLASVIGLPFASTDRIRRDDFDLLLMVSEQRLELWETGRKRQRPLFVDFVAGPTAYRRRTGLSRRQLIARAMGLGDGPVTVLDATAGLGRDAFLLACLGCTVHAVERSPVMSALLGDGLERAARADEESLRQAVARVHLTTGDARDALQNIAHAPAPDVVYLDPMYPMKKKSALAQKEMQICRRLVGDDGDAGELLSAARRVARRRVAVKRHRHAPPLGDDVDIRYEGRTVRFDVYLTKESDKNKQGDVAGNDQV